VPTSAFLPTPDARSFRSGAGEIVIWFPSEGIAAARVIGHIRAGIAIATYAEIDRYALAHAHPGRGFVDFSEMTAFDWDARGAMMRWNIANRKKATRMDVISGTWFAHLALTALGTVLGDRLVSHSERSTFEAAYVGALHRERADARRSLSG
jgi:hypothetical protein